MVHGTLLAEIQSCHPLRSQRSFAEMKLKHNVCLEITFDEIKLPQDVHQGLQETFNEVKTKRTFLGYSQNTYAKMKLK